MHNQANPLHNAEAMKAAAAGGASGGAPKSRRKPLAVVAVALAVAAAGGMFVIHHSYTQQVGERTKARVARNLRSPSKSIHGDAAAGAARPKQHAREAVVEAAAKTRPPLPVSPPYLALDERFNSTTGTIYRDRASESDAWDTMTWRTISHESPRAFYAERFWTDEECEWVKGVADAQLRRSEVVGQKGASRKDGVRTSNGMFITHPDQANSPIIQAARQRVSMLVGLPAENVEATQVLRYNPGERYLAHPDYFATIFKEHLARGGQRVATILSWLGDTPTGGHTTFPHSTNPATGKPYQVPPRKGDAIVFWDCGRVCIILTIINNILSHCIHTYRNKEPTRFARVTHLRTTRQSLLAKVPRSGSLCSG